MPKPRYLTPSRVALLVLVNLYCTIDIPSTATVPVLSFILSNSLPAPLNTARSRYVENHDDAPLSLLDFEEMLENHAANMPGRTLLDDFLKHMWEINTFDSLFRLFERLGDLFKRTSDDSPARIHLSQTSPLGALVRRSRIEWTRLQIDDIRKLWTAYIQYRAPTAPLIQRLAALASSGVDAVATDMGLDPGHGVYEVTYGNLSDEDDENNALSNDDVERLLDSQLDRLQRLGCRVSSDTKDTLRKIFDSSGILPRQAHLVQFFDSWRAAEYNFAFEKLHRYFDYAMQSRQGINYQYALLHMAILQADFGCFEQAVAAINEAIATARENQDNHCLNFSLNWLHHMTTAYPKQMRSAGYAGALGSQKEALAFLKAKAKESKTYMLLGATLLNEAKLCLSAGESVSRAFEYTIEASHLNIKEGLGSHGAQILVESAIYSRLGIDHLSDAYCELLLKSYDNRCPVEECVRATSRQAFLACKSGRYKEAIRLLEASNPNTPETWKLQYYVFLCTKLVNLKRATHRMDWHQCDLLLHTLSPDANTDPELVPLIAEATFECSVARGLRSEARCTIDELSDSLREEDADIMERVFVLIAEARLFVAAEEPERGLSVALRAAAVAFKARLMPRLMEAIGVIANILNAMRDFVAAAKLLQAIIPQSLETTDEPLTGRLYSYLADSYVGIAGKEDPSSAEGIRMRATYVSRAELFIDRARACFHRVQDRDSECGELQKKVLFAKIRGDVKLAEEWAQHSNRVWNEKQREIGDDPDRDPSTLAILQARDEEDPDEGSSKSSIIENWRLGL